MRAQSNKVGRLWFLGGRCSRISGGTPEARSRRCVCRASFLMTFVTSGMSLAGSRQTQIPLKAFPHHVCDILCSSSWKINLQKSPTVASQYSYFLSKHKFHQFYCGKVFQMYPDHCNNINLPLFTFFLKSLSAFRYLSL